jgi:phospholipid-binding lipoprotein MlaA
VLLNLNFQKPINRLRLSPALKWTVLCILLLPAGGYAQEVNDPFESINRATSAFNNVMDALILKPVATVYERYTPPLAKRGVRNFFSNLDDVVVVINDLLQFKFKQASTDFGRLAVNSTLGVGGIINVASPWFAWHKHNEDFGQTLGYWGVGPGPYLVLPIFGPSSLRDSIGLMVDSVSDPVYHLETPAPRNALGAVRVFEFRSRSLSYDDTILGDQYLFLRNSYLQYRDFLVTDGRQAVAFEDF